MAKENDHSSCSFTHARCCRPDMFRQVISLQVHLVDVAPAPVLAAFSRLDDRVLGRMEMRARMTVL